MFCLDDNYLIADENALYSIALSSVIGDRESQQDSAGYALNERDGVLVLCDGIGGQKGGRAASALAVNTALAEFDHRFEGGECSDEGEHAWLIDTIRYADSLVCGLEDESGESLDAGSTAVMVLLKGNQLFWASVGDSRLYIFRDGESLQATHDHTYQMVLDRDVESGAIGQEEYEEGMGYGGALVSYLGAGTLPFIDANESPFKLQSGDRLLLTSDGLCKVLADEEITEIVSNFGDVGDACSALEFKAAKAAKAADRKRDNTTVVLVKIR